MIFMYVAMKDWPKKIRVVRNNDKKDRKIYIFLKKDKIIENCKRKKGT